MPALYLVYQRKRIPNNSLLSFSFFKLINFNWKIIALQYCDAFVIHQHESATGTRVSTHPELPFHLPPHLIPLGCPRAPALGALLHALQLALAIYFTYGNVHVSITFSQIIPPSPSPTELASAFKLFLLKQYSWLCLAFSVTYKNRWVGVFPPPLYSEGHGDTYTLPNGNLAGTQVAMPGSSSLESLSLDHAVKW